MKSSAAGKKTVKKGASGSAGKARAGSVSARIRNEVRLLIAFALTLLCTLSVFGMCGRAGTWMKDVLFGIFGVMAYIMPILLFILFIFTLSNLGNGKAMVKILAALVGTLDLGGLLQMAMVNYDASASLKQAYMAKTGGGWIGGLIQKGLCSVFGIVGAYIIIVLILLICVVLITEVTISGLLSKGGSAAYRSAKEEMEYQKQINEERRIRKEEARQQKEQEEKERKKLRMEHKVRGVAIGAKVVDSVSETVPEKRPEEEEDKTCKPADPAVECKEEEPVPQQDGTEGQADIEQPGGLERPDEINFLEDEVDRRVDRLKREMLFRPDRTDAFAEEEIPAGSESKEDVSFDDETGGEKESTLPSETEQTETEFSPAGYDTGTGNGAARRDTDRGEKDRESGGVGEPEKLSGEAEKKLPPAKPYEIPRPDKLLRKGKGAAANSPEELRQTAEKLKETLKKFGVNVTITNVSRGPSVTRYELLPEPGTRVSKITSLNDDIKLNLAATDIRMEAPIPGKSAIGIEVPNRGRDTVYLRELLEAPEYRNHPSKIAFAVGKDIAGKVVVADIAKMPHMLIAGTTGSGKSVFTNSIIMSILFRATPEEVKLIIVDPKVVEFGVYNGIPHLFTPVVTDPKKAANALNWAVAEMSKRYKIFADTNVRDLKGYNEKIKKEQLTDENDEPLKPLPQIVIIIDELADLMMVAAKEVEESICRLAQLARAAGIHLIIATQRPSVDVVTGLIKANIPSRVALLVSSGIDSRTIIDMNGAEKLLGNGDMLFAPSGYVKPVRVQGAFVSDEEVHKVVQFLTDQNTQSECNISLENQMEAPEVQEEEKSSQRDPYFEEAGRFVIEKDRASTSMLQRMFKVGFNRAGRIMDQLAEAGVVGQEEGTKPRKVLMTMEEFEESLK